MLPPPVLSERIRRKGNDGMSNRKPWSVPTIVTALVSAAVLLASLVFLISVMH